MKDIDTNVYWTSPSGQIFTLKTDQTGYKQKHVGEVRENPKAKNSNRKKVQDVSDTFNDLGIGGRDLSLKFFFMGENHAADSEKFENALAEKGKSILQIPYREPFTVNVLDFEISNDLKILNQTVVSVSFHQTAKTKFPTTVKSSKKAVQNKISAQSNKIAKNLEKTVAEIQDETRKNSFVSSFSSALSKVNGVLSEINNVSVNAILADVLNQDILSNVGTISSQVFTMFREVGRLKNKAANFVNFDFSDLVNLSSLQALENILKSLKIERSFNKKSDIDKLVIDKSFGDMAILADSDTIADKDFSTRKDAIDAALDLKETFENWNDYVEDELGNITDLGDLPLDNGEIRSVVNQVVNSIIERSFDLKIEKRIILTESTTPWELAYKYYPEDFEERPDDTVDYLIQSNNLTDDEFFLLERGKAVKIYV